MIVKIESAALNKLLNNFIDAPTSYTYRTLKDCTDEQLNQAISDGWQLVSTQYLQLGERIATCATLRMPNVTLQISPDKNAFQPGPRKATANLTDLTNTIYHMPRPGNHEHKPDLTVTYAEALQRQYPADALRQISTRDAKATFLATATAMAASRPQTETPAFLRPKTRGVNA